MAARVILEPIDDSEDSQRSFDWLVANFFKETDEVRLMALRSDRSLRDQECARVASFQWPCAMHMLVFCSLNCEHPLLSARSSDTLDSCHPEAGILHHLHSTR